MISLHFGFKSNVVMTNKLMDWMAQNGNGFQKNGKNGFL